MTNEHGLTAPQWAWDVKNVSPSEKLVLLALASFQITHDGMASPSKRELMDRCCMKSKRTVDTAIDGLEDAGLIRRYKRKDEAGNNRTNIYHLMIGQGV